LRGSGRGERRLRDTALVALRPLLALAPDLDLEPLAERVDDRDADAVEAARHLVHGVLELSARVEDRQDDLRGGLAALLVDIDRDPASVVAHRARAVSVQDDLDVIADTSQRLVHGVVDGLVDEVVETVRARVPDVHRGALADGLEALEDLDVARRVRLGAHAATTAPALTEKTAAPFTVGGSGVVRKPRS